MHTIVGDARSEYSGIRGGGRGKVGVSQVGSTIQHLSSYNHQVGHNPMIGRANTIHRTLMVSNQQILKQPKTKKKSTNTRKSQHSNGVSLKTEIRGGHQQDMRQLYSSNQPQRSYASNRGNSMVSANGSVTSKQFAQVRLRQDISVKSNKSPNRYSVVSGGGPRQMAQQTIQYGHSKPIPGSLATIGVAGSVNIDRNRVGNSLNKPLPIDSVGLKSTIAKTGNRGHSLISNDGRITNNISSLNPLDDVKSQNKAILRADNPLLQKKDVPSRDGSNSQRSFRIRKGYVRSISRGSNLSQDHANQGRLIDNNQNTIEHPTDIEDNKFDPEQSRDFSEFEHLN